MIEYPYQVYRSKSKKKLYNCVWMTDTTLQISRKLNTLKNDKFIEIDLVIVNFYPFENIVEKSSNYKKIIENIDIGGPTMVRAAAKNYNDVTVITSVKFYSNLIDELEINNGCTSLDFRQEMSEIAFTETAFYDSVISSYFNFNSKKKF